jgi:hypothetical protein
VGTQNRNVDFSNNEIWKILRNLVNGTEEITGKERLSNHYIARYLDTVGDGTGTIQANGDYSGGEEIFFIQPPAGNVFSIARLIVYIEDTIQVIPDNYGGISALANGVTIRVQDDTRTVKDCVDGQPIKTNGQWSRVCFDVNFFTAGSGNKSVVVRWTFAKSGIPLTLRGSNNERLEAVVNDDLRGLVEHTFMVQGFLK